MIMNWYKKLQAGYLNSPEKWKEIVELLEKELGREPSKYETIMRMQKIMYDMTSDSWPQLAPEKTPPKKRPVEKRPQLTPQLTSELVLV